VFSQKTSIFFKTTRIYRLVDKPRNTLVYLAISTKIVSGSPANATSAVPVITVANAVTILPGVDGSSVIPGSSADMALHVPHLILRDGTPFLIHRLLAEDAALYPDFLSEVAAGDLRLRFFVSMREVNRCS
jgi:hypothetical protein